VWRISNGELVWNEVKNSMAVSFSPDGRYLAYADIDDNSNVFLNTEDGSEIVHVLAGHPGPVWGMIFSPDSQLLVSTDGLEIRIWRIEDGSLRYTGKAACP
jgi:WD40 repeat protein